MSQFVIESTVAVSTAEGGCSTEEVEGEGRTAPRTQIGVVQFSNDAQVEYAPHAVASEAELTSFRSSMTGLVRGACRDWGSNS